MLKAYIFYRRNFSDYFSFSKEKCSPKSSLQNIKISKLSDKLALENCIIICKSLHQTSKNLFWLVYSRWENKGFENAESRRSTSHGRYSITKNAKYIQSCLQNLHQGTIIYFSRTKQLKDFIINYFFTRSISSYSRKRVYY